MRSDFKLHSVDPATSIAFPTTLRIPSKTPLPTFSLVGVGVRTVSFLGIKVYSVGFYADLANPNLNVRPLVLSREQALHAILECRYLARRLLRRRLSTLSGTQLASCVSVRSAYN